MDLCSTLGANIRRLRTARGLSQEELAYRAQIDRSYLSEIENGKKNLGVLVLEAIAAALEVEAVALFKGYRRNAARDADRSS